MYFLLTFLDVFVVELLDKLSTLLKKKLTKESYSPLSLLSQDCASRTWLQLMALLLSLPT